MQVFLAIACINNIFIPVLKEWKIFKSSLKWEFSLSWQHKCVSQNCFLTFSDLYSPGWQSPLLTFTFCFKFLYQSPSSDRDPRAALLSLGCCCSPGCSGDFSQHNQRYCITDHINRVTVSLQHRCNRRDLRVPTQGIFLSSVNVWN